MLSSDSFRKFVQRANHARGFPMGSPHPRSDFPRLHLPHPCKEGRSRQATQEASAAQGGTIRSSLSPRGVIVHG